jgi:RNA polymerase sigma-70 factor, ECF subfamily
LTGADTTLTQPAADQPVPVDSGRRAANATRRPAPSRDHTGFGELYQARHGDVVAMAYALTGDFNEAQDIAQEAFCRAWQRWSALTEHEEPIAWVKRVAVNLAISRGRRVTLARRFGLRQRAAVAPPISVDHVALVTELRRLPATITRAMVLYYIADFPLEEIADALGTRVGTVKSWLHRGRQQMVRRLGDPAVHQREGGQQ